jgi:four helix bundle protein
MTTWKFYEEIEAWKDARLLCQEIFQMLQREGLKNDYALKDQLNRSSGSIMDNIAEGFGRDGTKECINFLSMAKGSANETRSQLCRVLDRNYISPSEFESLNDKTLEITNKIGALIAYLKKSNFKGIKFK